MTKIKLALCQMNVIDDKEANLKKATSMITDSANKNADFIVLPEMFNCPYSNDKFIEYGEHEDESITLKAISELAGENNVHILAGSIPEVLTAGDNVTVAETEFGKVGIGICYDVRFPELARLMVEDGALILFYPGAFNMTTGPAHWELLFRSRALDNQAFCVGVAPALNMDASYHSYGHSIVTNPWGEVISQADEKEDIIFCEIDLSEIKKVREELPLLKNKRKDLYEVRLL